MARQLLLQFQAAHQGHAHVEQQATRCMAIIALQEVARRFERRHLPAGRIEQIGQRAAHGGVVVDDKDDRIAFIHGVSSCISLFASIPLSSGRRNQTVKPGASALACADRLPPNDSMMLLLSDIPRPRPSALVVKKGSNKRAICAACRPQPASRTATVQAPFSRCSSTPMGCPGLSFSSCASSAFLSKLSSTCCTCCGSTSTCASGLVLSWRQSIRACGWAARNSATACSTASARAKGVLRSEEH